MKLARMFGVLLVAAASMLGGAVPATAGPTAVICDVTPGLPYKTGASVAVDGSVQCHDEANRPLAMDRILGQVALIRDDAHLANVEIFEVFGVSGHTKTISAACVSGSWQGAMFVHIVYQGQPLTEGVWYGPSAPITC